jgi:hypothetical protein
MKNMLKPAQQDAMRFRMPVGTAGRGAVVCADAEIYAKGTTVIADSAFSAAVRPNVLDVPGVRSWSPPV